MILDRLKKGRRCQGCRCSNQQLSLDTTLDGLKRGQRCRIISIPSEITRAQAIRLDIAEGEIITCGEKVPAGPVVIVKNRQEIAVGRKLAQQIQVVQISS